MLTGAGFGTATTLAIKGPASSIKQLGAWANLCLSR